MTEISKEYGAALFMLACEENQKDAYAKALDVAEQAFLENPDFPALLHSPAVSKKERLAILDTVFSSVLPEQVLAFFKLLCERGHILSFQEAMEAYRDLYRESERVIEAKIISAVELTDAEKEKMQKKLETMHQRSVKAEYITDASLMGGVIVEADGKVLDGSVKRRLQEIKDVISS